MRELKRYFSYLGKYKYIYWTIFAITIIASAAIEVLYSYMNKIAFNAVEYGNRELFVQAVVLCVIAVALGCSFSYLRYFEIRTVRKVVFDIKIRLFHKLMKLDMEYYEKHHSAEALKTLNWDANSLKDSYFSHVYWVTGKITDGVTAIIAMFLYNRMLACISITFSIITVYISIKINQEIKKMDKKIQGSLSRLAQRLSDILSGFTLLKMYPGSVIVQENFMQENDTVTGEERQRVHKLSMLEMISFFMGIVGSFGTIMAGSFLVAEGAADYGTVMAVVSLQMSVSAMVQRFGFSVTTFTSSIVKAGRVFDFLEMDCEEIYKDTVRQQENIKENYKPIVIEGLGFSYDGDHKVLDNFNMQVSEKEKILLMGESGCGKSTLLKLLMRFYEKTEGKILLYGRDINEYSLEQLRDCITYIPQNNYLFEGTIRENIAFGNNSSETVAMEDVEKAAKHAYAHEFIMKLPQGYETRIEAGGSNLSGGQRQRIAIARAFIKNAPILLMDEPSSALDVHSEKMIHLAMKELMNNKIVLMVTHRMSSFEGFDRVVELK